MRGPRSRPRFVVAVVLTVGATSYAAAQEPVDRGAHAGDREAFYRAVGAHFGVPLREVQILGQAHVRPEELPVVLFVAARTGISPDVVVSLRRTREAWAEIAARYGVGGATFHLPLEGDPAELGPPLEVAYQRFTGAPPAEWDRLVLSDPAIVHLVNLRFLAAYLRTGPMAVLEARRATDDFVGAYARLAGGR